jgi:hypothetical protein
MKVRVVVTDGGGNTFEGEATLVAVAGARAARPTPRGQPQPSTRTKPDFSLPVRAFIKQHVKGLGGPQKFTALLAKLSGGKTGTAVERREIEKTWNRMTALMGGGNSIRPTRREPRTTAGSTRRRPATTRYDPAGRKPSAGRWQRRL